MEIYNDYTLDTIDGSKYLFNPIDKKDFDKLKKYEEFKVKLKKLSLDKIIPYIILTYDFNSELRREIKDHHQRKIAVIKMVGYDISDITNKFDTNVEQVLFGENQDVNSMIIRYVSLFGKPEFVQLTTYYELFVRENKRIMDGQVEGQLKQIIAGLNDLQSSIQSLEEKLFGGKESIDFKQDLYSKIEKKRLRIRMEDVAEDLSKGVEPMNGYNPYGKDYIPKETLAHSVDESFKYIGDK